MPVESFLVVHLDGNNRRVGMTTCSIGSMTSSPVHPRDVFRPAIANMTAGLIFIHNHPSGDPAPSDEDLQITKRLCEVEWARLWVFGAWIISSLAAVVTLALLIRA